MANFNYKENIYKEYLEEGFVVFKDVMSDIFLKEIKKVISFPFQKQLDLNKVNGKDFDITSVEDHLSLINLNRKIHTNACIASRNALCVSGILSNKKILDIVSFLSKSELLSIATLPVLSFHNKEIANSNLYWKIPPHIDYASMQGSLNGLVVWIPFLDISDELGPLNVLPKSHLRNYDLKK